MPVPDDPNPPVLPGPDVPEPVPDDRAVLDRIVDDATAVLLVGPNEVEVHVPADALPDGATDGTWLVLDLDGDMPRVIAIDQRRTDDQRANLENRMARIRATRSRGRFQRNDASSMLPVEPDDDGR